MFSLVDARPPTVQIMRNLGLEPDPWQIQVLETQHPRVLLNCCRQAGKSTVVAVLALVEALFTPMCRVVILSRSHRQAKELFRQINLYLRALGDPLLTRRTAEELEFNHLSRIVCLPCKEETIRGFAKVNLMIIDEAARVPDDLYRAVRPMLAVSRGRMFLLSTPYGKRGFYHDAWARGGDDWLRFEVPAAQCPRIEPEFLEKERRAIGEAWYRQEYCCSFEAMEGLVYPDFARCVVTELPEHVRRQDAGWRIGRGPWRGPPVAGYRRVGGIDFGFRNPFAAVWGLLDRDDVLWLVGEHYARQRPLSYHIEHIPRDVYWYADPAGATERAELVRADFRVREGVNTLVPGIAAVTARLEAGRLFVLQGRCPNLVSEAGLYRYDDSPQERNNENPLDAHNHALAALRYLISRIDVGKLNRWRREGMGAND